jgi:hypothetical protein
LDPLSEPLIVTLSIVAALIVPLLTPDPDIDPPIETVPNEFVAKICPLASAMPMIDSPTVTLLMSVALILADSVPAPLPVKTRLPSSSSANCSLGPSASHVIGS